MFWNPKKENNTKRKKKSILTDIDVKKISIVYLINGIKKREDVRLRFLNDKECYLSSQLSVIKPKPKTQIVLSVFTPDGVYKTEVTLVEVIDNFSERILSVSVPEIWKLSQMRVGSRIDVELPIKIRYGDGMEISTTSVDLSPGGVSFTLQQEIPDLYKMMPAVCLLKLPDNVEHNFQKGFMACETKFQREKSGNAYGFNIYDTTYVYKFLTMSNDDIIVLKEFLTKNKSR